MTEKILKDGSVTRDDRLDRVYQLDLRSLNYAVGDKLPTEAMYRPRGYTWSVEEQLDQGYEGACVGFAFAHDLAARPVSVEGLDNEYARQVYFEAQKIDYWAGGAYPGASPFYEGTSVLAGAKICKREGFFNSYYWGLTIDEIAKGIAYFGPCVLGIDWYSGMSDTDPDGFIAPIGSPVGGHAILAHAIKIEYKSTWGGWWNRTWADVDWDKSYITLHNSWGPHWGENGRARLRLRDLAHLMLNQGEACFPLRNPSKLIVD